MEDDPLSAKENLLIEAGLLKLQAEELTCAQQLLHLTQTWPHGGRRLTPWVHTEYRVRAANVRIGGGGGGRTVCMILSHYDLGV